MAIKRFDETRKSIDPLMGYRSIIGVFVTRGNTVKDYDIRERGSKARNRLTRQCSERRTAPQFTF